MNSPIGTTRGNSPATVPLLTTLSAGVVRVQVEGEDEHTFYVGGGALEVQPNRVSVLADTAARALDLDEAAAQAAKQRAEEAVRGHTDKIDIAEAQAELARAIAQLKAIGLLRKKR